MNIVGPFQFLSTHPFPCPVLHTFYLLFTIHIAASTWLLVSHYVLCFATFLLGSARAISILAIVHLSDL